MDPIRVFFLLISLLVTQTANCETYDKALTIAMKDESVTFTFEGAFKFPSKTYGDSKLTFANGTFAVNEENSSVFIVGHNHHQAIAEFSLPRLVNSTELDDLNSAKIKQPFVKNIFSGRVKNPESLDTITGMEFINGELVVNALKRYDAPGKNKLTTFFIRNPNNLKDSDYSSLLSLNGKAHSAGWISKLPQHFEKEFGAKYLHGYANNISINSRLSIGPTAFVSNIDALTGVDLKQGESIPAFALMDFSIKQPMVQDLYNKKRNNDVWTEISSAYYGFIPPNSNKYLILGKTGGHKHGLGYKITNKVGKECPGACAFDPADEDNFYWAFDTSDLVKSHNKVLLKHQIRPVSYGKLRTPFNNYYNGGNLLGADFTNQDSKLYLLVNFKYRNEQKEIKRQLVMLIFKLVHGQH